MRRSSTALLVTALALAAGPAVADDAPKIRSVVPASAFRGSTVDVTLEGLNLVPYDEIHCSRPDIAVVVQPVPTPYKVVLRLVIPDTSSAGPVELSIKTKTGVVKTEKFAVKLRTPVVSKTTPGSIVRGTETDVRLEGSNLSFLGQETVLALDAPMTAKIVGKPAEKLLVVHVVVPAATPIGLHPLTLETSDGKVATNLNVALAPPVITTIAPTGIARGAQSDLVISGKNLSGSGPVLLAIPDALVEVAAKGAPTVGSIPLRVTVKPEAAPGPRLLVVQTPDGAASARLEILTPSPRLAALKPSGVARGSEVAVTPAVDGAPGAYALRVLPADPSLSVTAEPSGRWKIRAAPDATPGPRTIVLDHPFGAAATTFSVSLRSPSLAGLSPAELAPGAEADVIVEGQALEGASASLAQPDASVAIRPGPGPGVVHVTVAADAKPGPRAVVVRTADGAAVTTFTVTGASTSPPALSAASSSRVPRGRATEVQFTGVNLRSGGDQPPTVTASTLEGPVPATIVTSSSTALKVRLEPSPMTAAGGCIVVVSTSEGVAAAAVTVVPASPVLSVVTPSRLLRPGDAQVEIAGSDLICPGGLPPTVSLVRPDGSAAIAGHVNSAAADKVVVTLPLVDATTPGAWVLVLSTGEGGAALVVPVDPAIPSIEAIEPTMLGIPASVQFTVRGKNLVGPGGKPPTLFVTRVGSASNLRPDLLASKPDALSVRITTPAGSPAGPHVLVVKTADGATAGLFEVVNAPMPTITSFEPLEGTRLATVTVILKGTGLLGASAVTLSGKGVTAVIQPGGSDTTLPLRVSVAGDAEAGPRSLTVTTPGGQATNEKLQFTVK